MRKFYEKLVALLTPIVRFLYPYRLTVRGELPEGAALVCANHSSDIDPVLVAIIFGKRHFLRFMAKAELFKVPVIGWIVKKVGAFPADRDGQDVNALRTSIQILKSGEKLMLFPEGTRVSEDDAVAAKAGAVRLASKHNVPIVPVFISRDKHLFRKFDICIGEPYFVGRIPRGDFPKAAEELMEKIAELNPEAK